MIVVRSTKANFFIIIFIIIMRQVYDGYARTSFLSDDYLFSFTKSDLIYLLKMRV